MRDLSDEGYCRKKYAAFAREVRSTISTSLVTMMFFELKVLFLEVNYTTELPATLGC